MTDSARPSATAARPTDTAIVNPLDHLVHQRRQALAAEESYLSEIARQAALMRWRGLTADSHAA